MARWRRLCIDVTDDGSIVGASVEYFSERKSERVAVAVMARSAFRGHTRQDLIEELEQLHWPQPGLPFNWHMVGGPEE